MRLLLVDGHYYLYRSFFAIRGLKNSRGEPTNAIYGFVKALRKMLIDLKPDFAVVVWDAGLPERRTTLQPTYKEHREEMPKELQAQQDPLRELITLLGVTSISSPQTEADDLIASYVVMAQAQGIESIVATNDKDIMQLVSEEVKIYSVAKADIEEEGCKTRNHALLGPPEVEQKWGVKPSQIVDLLALTGDTVDNIPGIAGVGRKTAAKWIQQFGSLERLLATSHEDPKIHAKIESAHVQLLQNREMIQLHLDLPLPLPIEAFEINPDYPGLFKAFHYFEFRSLAKDIEQEAKRWGISLEEGD
ncbi:MAG: 5'-3' exonuclease [Chthoniobacterales bacterium]